jgi:uncharacterized Zn-binding protein involved in type VI secretion
MPPAARLTDMHACPMVTPGQAPIPHVGGPVIGPGVPSVLIGKLPAAVVGDNAVCVGPPDLIVSGSATVMIAGRPAARVGDATAHGGRIVLGLPTVVIGG